MLGSLVVCFSSCAHTLSFFSCWGTPEFNDACNAVWRSMVTNGIDAQRLFLAHQISWMQGDTQTATYIGWHDDSIDIFHKRCLPTPPNFQLHSNFNWESNASVRYDGLGKRRPRKPPIDAKHDWWLLLPLVDGPHSQAGHMAVIRVEEPFLFAE